MTFATLFAYCGALFVAAATPAAGLVATAAFIAARRLKKTSSKKAIGRFFSHVLHARSGCALWFPHAFDPIVVA